MTQQPVSARRLGFWDAVFGLVFGRRGAPAPRPQPEPNLGPAPAPRPSIEPPPTPELEAPTPAPEPAPPTEPPAPPTLESPTPPPADSTPAPGAAITPFVQRLVDVCVAEWNFFQQGSLRETEDAASARIATYWANVGQDWTGHTPQPWSAAFISFAMKEAGDNGKFKKSTSHSTYINDAIKRADEADAPFHGKRIEDYAPQVGDLICRYRDVPVTYDTALAINQYKSHTDIVTAIKAGEVEMIGGNLSHSVSVRRLPLLPDGRLEPNVAAASEVFAIMKNNL